MKKKASVILLCGFLILTEATCVFAGETEIESPLTTSIDNFRDYKWGTPIDELKKNEISTDMKENFDYEPETESNDGTLSSFRIIDGVVGGYSADICYTFFNGKLTAGEYDLSLEDNDYTDLVKKYSDKYGNPVVEKESVGWGPCSVWIDSEHNFIFIDSWGISYISSDSPLVEAYSESLYKYHEISLEKELNKIGNTDGI